ncbi:MAG: penicillin-binding protein 2 [Thermaceae bacterium]|nr:penicillin-binding protein 2 [Thermaceae bacterium]
MTQATLSRAWVISLASLVFAGGLGYGLYTLYHNAPELIARANRIPTPPPPRGTLEAADGTPIATSTNDTVRLHPLGLSMSQVIGFGERANGKGLSGLERDLQATLATGSTVRLTLDPAVQAIAEQALWKWLQASGSDWGTALVMETRTGKLLAVANGPAFDPTAPRGNPQTDISWRNHAFSVPIEPGSTMKALTAAVLLQEGAATLDSRVDAPMWRKVGGWTINDVIQHPSVLTLREVLEYSSNVGISRLAERLPPDFLYNYMKKLHLADGKPLPAVTVAEPRLRPLAKWGAIEYANATFGQGFLITPLHLTAAYNALANNGVYLPPTLLEGQSAKGEPIFRPEVAQAIRTALGDNAEKIARSAFLPGYYVGGKTGTAQVVINGRYSPSVFSALYAGFIPADNPKVTVVVVFYHPKGERIHGAYIAAPVFHDIAAGLFALWGIPPDFHRLDQLESRNKTGKLANR